MKCLECENIHNPKISDFMVEGKMDFSFWEGKFHHRIYGIYLAIALDYAIINWGLTSCGGKRSKVGLVNLPQAIEGVYLG